MDALYRHWLILRMIPRRGRIATTDILGRLQTEYSIETTLRTIQRDLLALEAGEFPLECDGNRPAGWSWRKDAASFDIPNMDPVTALTFKLAEQYLRKMLPAGVLTALEPYVRTANERLKLTTESSLAKWPDKVRVMSRNLATMAPKIEQDIAEGVYRSLLEERRFKACYRNVGGKSREYEVNPLGLVFVEGLVYLIASLNEHTAPVMLLMHRIRAFEPLDKPAVIPPGFVLDEYMQQELIFPVGGEIRLKVLFDNKTDVQRLAEAPIAPDQLINARNDGKFEVSATIMDTLQLHWWLRGFGVRVEVLEPASLRAEFAQLSQKIAEMYKASDTVDSVAQYGMMC